MAEQNNQAKQEQQQDIGQLLKVRREKLANLQEAGKDPFQITKYDATHHSTEIKERYGELEGKTVRIAGRVMSKRIMGKASFAISRIYPAISSAMWPGTASARKPMRISKSMMWAISWASRVKCSPPRRGKSPYMPFA